MSRQCLLIKIDSKFKEKKTNIISACPKLHACIVGKKKKKKKKKSDRTTLHLCLQKHAHYFSYHNINTLDDPQKIVYAPPKKYLKQKQTYTTNIYKCLLHTYLKTLTRDT